MRTFFFFLFFKAKYSDPVITSMPKEIVNDGPTELSCNATGGYPAGTIHWFDQSNTNWTKSATLQSTQGSNGRFTLSSKLSFKRFDAIWAPFRCVVLNSKYKEEGGSMSTGQIKGKYRLVCQKQYYLRSQLISKIKKSLNLFHTVIFVYQ